jgi:hypothetical protein
MDSTTESVLGVLLRNWSAIQAIDFRLDGLAVNPVGYRTVADALRDGRVRAVRRKMPAGWEAAYDDKKDLIQLPRLPYGNTTEEATHLVHECTHAIFDGSRCVHTTEIEGECAAYLAGAIFHRLAGGEWLFEGEWNPAAFRTANQVVRANGLLEGRGKQLSGNDYWPLKQALWDDPIYVPARGKSLRADGFGSAWRPWQRWLS